jgi:hypothetical protein
VEIGEGCFKDSDIASISLPPTIKRIQAEAFQRCKHLRYISIPDGCFSIGHRAFSSCGLKSISLPPNIRKIAAEAFCSTALREVHFPKRIRLIGKGAFTCNHNLSLVTFEEDTECEIKERAFRRCAIEEVVLHQGMTVASDAFDSRVGGIHVIG